MIGALFITMAIILAVGVLPLSVYLLRSMQRREPEASGALDEELTRKQAPNEPFEWWETQRGRFNRGLALAGVAAGLLYYGLGFYQSKWAPNADFQFNWLSFFFYVAGYLVYMGVANLIYNIGLILEQVRPPKDLPAFRLKLFGWLYGMGMGVPFMFLIYLLCLSHD